MKTTGKIMAVLCAVGFLIFGFFVIRNPIIMREDFHSLKFLIYTAVWAALIVFTVITVLVNIIAHKKGKNK